MARVTWSEAAIQHIDGIVDYIEQFNPEAARSTADSLFAIGESLADFPNRGRPAGRNSRELNTVSPYILRYQIRSEIVTIISVRHSAQRTPD